MIEMRITYATWKAVANINTALSRYHRTHGLDSLIAYTGNREYVYRCAVSAEDYADWKANYSSGSIEVASGDDALALLVGTSLSAIPPRKRDGKPVQIMTPSTSGWNTWFVGAGDDANPTPPVSGRGDGTKLRLTFTAPGVQECEIQNTEVVELHDGQLYYTPVGDWSPDDRWDFFVRIPATVVTPNATNTGNCDLVPQTGYNVIVPAAGTGAYDVDLATACPIPSDDMSTGYWDCDYQSGLITPSASPGTAEYHLMDVSIESYFMRNMPAGNPLGIFDIDTYDAEWIHFNWKLVMRMNRVSAGAGPYEVTAWLMFFRQETT